MEKIVDSRVYWWCFEYKVQWKGYGYHEQTWEPISNITNADKAIADFHRLNPKKLTPPKLWKIEIPIAEFPVHLFQSMLTPDSELTSNLLPTESFLNHAVCKMEFVP